MYASFHGQSLDWLASLHPWIRTTLFVVGTFVAGVLLIGIAMPIVRRLMRKSSHVDATLESFLAGVIHAVAWTALAVVVLGVAGVDVTSLVAGLAIGGFIIGFALKDTLGNLAAGVMLLFQRPFDVDDRVEIAGVEGWVEAMGVATTRMRTPDNKGVVIPNRSVYGDAIINHTAKEIRRADIVLGIDYADDIDVATQAIFECLEGHEDVLTDKEPKVRVNELADSTVNLKVMAWVKTDGYWDRIARLRGDLKIAVEQAGCSLPSPQRELFIKSQQ